MAYHDPYNQQYGRYQDHRQSDLDLNPYSNSQQPYNSYDQGGPMYHDYTTQHHDGFHEHHSKEPEGTSGFERGEFNMPMGEKRPTTLRQYRDEYRGNLWTAGGRGRCIGRFLCCTIMIAVFLILSIILALALWIRPPSVTIGSATLDSSGTGVQVQDTGLTVPLEVNISVNNPNYFSVDLKKLKVELSYSVNNNDTSIGDGQKNDITFHSNSNTSFTFPFDIEYQFADDPNFNVLIDMAKKCGVLGGTKSNWNIDYKITLGLHILIVNISPTVSNTFSVACPFTDSQLQDLLKQFGLGSLVGSS